jgi:hypothetical protein
VTVVAVTPDRPALPPAPRGVDDAILRELMEMLVNDGLSALRENHEESIRNLVPSMPPERDDAAQYAHDYGVEEVACRLREMLAERYAVVPDANRAGA